MPVGYFCYQKGINASGILIMDYSLAHAFASSLEISFELRKTHTRFFNILLGAVDRLVLNPNKQLCNN